MTRWKTEFDSNPIHATLKNVRGFLDSESTKLDAEIELEKRRLIKVLDALENTLTNADPEVVPISLINQINGHLREPQFFNQLDLFSKSPISKHIRNANNHIDSQIALYYQLNTFSRSKNAAAVTKSVEEASDSFVQRMAKILEEQEGRVAEVESEHDGLVKRMIAAEEKLPQWQGEFTEAQTSRAEAFSEKQIENDKTFHGWLDPFKGIARTNLEEISDTQKKKAKEQNDSLAVTIELTISEIIEKRDSIRELHGLVADDSVNAGFLNNAADEKKQASFWRIVSIAFMVLAAGWLGYTIFVDLGGATETISWVKTVKSASLAAILLSVAAYAARQSGIHRNNEIQTRRFALEVQAIGPFIASLDKTQQASLKEKLVERLFGQNANSLGAAEAGPASDVVKLISDMVAKLPRK